MNPAPNLVLVGAMGAGKSSLGKRLARRLALELVDADELKLILLGGEYHPTYNAFIGHICESALARLRVNLLICSASAVDGTAALIQDPQVVRVKQAMAAAAARRVLLIDSSKFGKVALHMFADLTEFDVVLADDALPEETARVLAAAGVTLKIVSSS